MAVNENTVVEYEQSLSDVGDEDENEEEEEDMDEYKPPPSKRRRYCGGKILPNHTPSLKGVPIDSEMGQWVVAKMPESAHLLLGSKPSTTTNTAVSPAPSPSAAPITSTLEDVTQNSPSKSSTSSRALNSTLKVPIENSGESSRKASVIVSPAQAPQDANDNSVETEETLKKNEVALMPTMTEEELRSIRANYDLIPSAAFAKAGHGPEYKARIRVTIAEIDALNKLRKSRGQKEFVPRKWEDEAAWEESNQMMSEKLEATLRNNIRRAKLKRGEGDDETGSGEEGEETEDGGDGEQTEDDGDGEAEETENDGQGEEIEDNGDVNWA